MSTSQTPASDAPNAVDSCNDTDGEKQQKQQTQPQHMRSGRLRGIGRVTGRLLGAGMQRLEMSLESLETGLEGIGDVIVTEAERRNFDGSRLKSFNERLGETSVKIRDSVVNAAESDTADRIRSTVGGTASIVGERLQEVRQTVNSDHAAPTNMHADDLASLRRHMKDEKQIMEAMNLSRQAEEACLEVCQNHLRDFVTKNPDGTYEQWLRELHPENEYEGKLLEGFSELDHRFFVKESDHLIMWNDSIDKAEATGGSSLRQRVQPRFRPGGYEKDFCDFDLLDMEAAVVGMETTTKNITTGTSSSSGRGDKESRRTSVGDLLDFNSTVKTEIVLVASDEEGLDTLDEIDLI